MMSSGWESGRMAGGIWMLLLGLLILIGIVLGIGALIKYLFFSDSIRSKGVSGP